MLQMKGVKHGDPRIKDLFHGATDSAPLTYAASAAAQCGKALPFRQGFPSNFLGGYASIPRRSLPEDIEANDKA